MGAAAESCARHLLGAPNVKIATSTSTSTKADHACVSGRLSAGVADRNEYAGICRVTSTALSHCPATYSTL